MVQKHTEEPCTWRIHARSGFQAAQKQLQQALDSLEQGHDYFAQVNGLSALRLLVDGLAGIATAIERRPQHLNAAGKCTKKDCSCT